ncbi:hypothetical protein [Nocardia bovistercoris]|uniref:Uncharacterized protein n=1 Tax=Nocardia bovistercoris TaxID=2785916 RepID=A0A931I816_9NOCA|nr:hypothetical protein [Nocardia bovistercoris]MBH0775457.1 hypothetical protein [Nocardia bovistercoris]
MVHPLGWLVRIRGVGIYLLEKETMVNSKTGIHRRVARRTTTSLLVGTLPVAVAIAAAPAFAAPSAWPSAVGESDFGVLGVPLAAVAEPEPGASVDPGAPGVPPASANTIRIGDIETGRPDFVPPDIAQQINDGAEAAESSLSDALESAGVEHARSDRVAEDVLGASVVGASVGATLASPVAATSALIGAATGLVVGIPFLPAGLVVMPVVCGVIGYGVIAAPAMAIGAAVGAAVGAVEGFSAPLPSDPGAPQPEAGA